MTFLELMQGTFYTMTHFEQVLLICLPLWLVATMWYFWVLRKY